MMFYWIDPVVFFLSFSSSRHHCSSFSSTSSLEVIVDKQVNTVTVKEEIINQDSSRFVFAVEAALCNHIEMLYI